MERKFNKHQLIEGRKRWGYSLRGAARLLGATPTQLMEWEKGKRIPDLKYIMRMSVLYKMLVDDLYCGPREEALLVIERNWALYGNPETDKPP